MRRRSPKRDKETEWRALALRRSGTIVPDRRNRIKQVVFAAGDWSIVLDSYTQSTGESSQSYTRIRAVYGARDDFRLRVGRRNLFSGLADRLGRRRVHGGHPQIEAKWIVRSKSEGRAQSLMMLPQVVNGLVAMQSGSVRIDPCRGRRAVPGTQAITITMTGTVTEPARLEGALDLCEASLEHLVRMGCATREPIASEPR